MNNDIYFEIDNLLQKLYILADDMKSTNYKTISTLIKDLIMHFWKDTH